MFLEFMNDPCDGLSLQGSDAMNSEHSAMRGLCSIAVAPRCIARPYTIPDITRDNY